MSHPASSTATVTPALPVENTFDPEHEYLDSTESKLDHTRPPHHDVASKNQPHQETPQISIGDG